MKRMTLLALGLSAAIALAACGSSTPKATVTPGGQPAASPSSTTPPTKKVAATTTDVKTAMTKFGTSLVDAQGMTLYTLTNAGMPVACTGQCATFWPPLFLPAGATKAVGVAGVTGLTTTSVGGKLQVAQNGDPLYRFSMDKAPGDTNGDGLSSFGGTWHVATVGQKTTAATTPATMPPATSPPATAAPAVAPAVTAPPATAPPATQAPTPTTAYSYGGY